MAIDPEVLRGVERAVLDEPENHALRLHLVSLLLESGRYAAALDHCEQLLAADPDNLAATESAARAKRLLDGSTSVTHDPTDPEGASTSRSPAGTDVPVAEPVPDVAATDADAVFDVFRPEVSLDDVAGMEAVKERIRLSFHEPLRNEELRRMYGKSLRTGLLLYGPPGCGKTFIAKALAGELGVYFLPVGIPDILDMWVGSSEKNVRSMFEEARRLAPTVLFVDELDALGHRRSKFRADSVGRNVVNQLLSELDGVESANEGVMVLAATNRPWDVDPALRRPGRFDRLVLVVPPDEAARMAILESALRDRPLEAGLDLAVVVAATDGYSGADLVHLCDTAAEFAMDDSIRTGTPRPMGTADLQRAVLEVRPSTGSWFAMAKNHAQFANEDGMYDDLLRYVRSRRL